MLFELGGQEDDGGALREHQGAAGVPLLLSGTVLYTVKKVSDFPVPSRDVPNQTHLGRD